MKNCAGKLVLILVLVLLVLAVSGCQAAQQSAAVAEPATATPAPNDAVESPADTGKTTTADPGSTAHPGGSDAPDTAKQADGSLSEEPTDSQVDESRPTGQVTLFISRDFGRQSLIQSTASLADRESVMDLLQSHAQVETKWDGSFVNSIEGLKSDSEGLSGNRNDWFFFINGICADVGAAEYFPQSGDMVWWDYHLWGDMGAMNAAVIGCYPEPFMHGYRGNTGTTTVMSSASNQSLAGKLQAALKSQGVKSVTGSLLNNQLLQNRTGPVIALGTWDELKQLPFLAGLNKAYRKTGLSVHFTDKGVELLDGRSRVVNESGPGTGIIAATGSGLGDPKVLWLIVGTDEEGLQSAVDLLVNHPAKIRGFYQAAVVSGKAVRLPME